MKILLVSDYFLPRLGYEAGLAEAYIKLGHDVLYSSSLRVPSEKAGMQAGDENTAIPHQLHLVLHAKGRHILIPGVALDIARFRPAVVHTHTFFDATSVMIALLKPIFRYRLIYSCHASNLNTDVDSSAMRRAIYAIWRCVGGRLIAAFADEVNGIGENEQALAAWGVGKSPQEIPIVRLGASMSAFAQAKACRRELRKQLGLGEQDVVLVHVGTLTKRKSIDVLIRAVARLRERGYPVKALVIGGGDPEYIASVRRVIEEEGVQAIVTLKGSFESRRRVADYYAVADVAVWPASISIASIEAMASGLPLVLRNDDPYREFLVSGDNGVLYPANGAEALSVALLPLVSDRSLRERMGVNSRSFAERAFSWDSIARGIVSRVA